MICDEKPPNFFNIKSTQRPVKEQRMFSVTLRVIFALFVISSFQSPAFAQTKSNILKYDKDGKVIGLESKELENKQLDKNGKKSKDAETGNTAKETFNPDTQFEKGEVLVLNPPDSFQIKVRGLGFKVVEILVFKKLGMEIVRLRTPSGMTIHDAIKTLARHFPGLTLEPNHNYNPSGSGKVSDIAYPKYLPRALFHWTKHTDRCGTGLRIGVIDSGVDLKHPALTGRDIIAKAFHKPGRKPGPKDHGTAVAGILVGAPKWGGLLPGATLYAADFIEYNERGRKVGSAMGLLRAAKWLIDEDVDIINLSITGADNKILKKFIQASVRKNVLLVAAVGNWGRSDKPAFPAAYKGVVAVTAVNKKGSIYRKANTGKYVDFAAPGVQVYTAMAGGGGRLQNGTSLAVPFVTALMGVEILRGTKRSHRQLVKALQSNVKDLGTPGRDPVFGWGFPWSNPKC